MTPSHQIYPPESSKRNRTVLGPDASLELRRAVVCVIYITLCNHFKRYLSHSLEHFVPLAMGASGGKLGWTATLLTMQDTPPTTAKVVRSLRLSQKADKVLRARVGRKGDVSSRVIEALTGTDLRAVDVAPRVKTPGSGRETFFATSVAFDRAFYENVSAIAIERNVSTASLIDAAVVSFYSRKRSAQV